MRVIPLHRDSDTDYSCISYWVLGDGNMPEDRNTLIDTGSTNLANLGHFMREMAAQSKGIGKVAIEQIIITHGHYDHAGGLAGLVNQFNPTLFSWLAVPGKYLPTPDGLELRVGDQPAVILHTPGHSDDSICVYVPATGVIFSGDTLFRISDNRGVYPQAYMNSLARLAALDIKVIYPGHGIPVFQAANSFIAEILEHVSHSLVAD